MRRSVSAGVTLLVAGLLIGACGGEAPPPKPAADEAVSPEAPRATEFEEGFLPLEDGPRLHYRLYGEGEETLVLLHGGPGANFMGVGPDLVPLADGYRLLMYDQRGAGRSDPDPKVAAQTADNHAEDLEAVRLALGLERMTLMGHSWGCILAAKYAARYPEHVDRLLLMGPMEPTRALLDKREAAEAAINQEVQEKLAALREREDLKADPHALCRAEFETIQPFYYYDAAKFPTRKGDYCDAPPDGMDRFKTISEVVVRALGDYDLTPALKELSMPALVIEGGQSPLPLEGDEVWARSLPNARLWLIDRVGHGYPFVEAPEVFFPGVRDFLEGGWPPGAVEVE